MCIRDRLNLVYVINNAGAVKVTQKLTADKNAKVSNMFRFGLQIDVYKRQGQDGCMVAGK